MEQNINVTGSTNVNIIQAGGDVVKLKGLEDSLKEARKTLTALEERFSKKDIPRGTKVRIKTGDISGSEVLIAGRDIGKESVSTIDRGATSPILQKVAPLAEVAPLADEIDIELGAVKDSRLKIAGRDYLQRIEISNEKTEIKAIETELSGLKKGVVYRDSWSFLKPDIANEGLLIKEAEKIIENKAIRIFYMPIVNFGQSKGEIIGYELLARGPEGSPLEKRPDKIFEIAGKINKLSELDLLCVKNALEASKKIPSGVRPFINIMPLTLLEDEFYRLIDSCERKDVIFEIKEDLIPSDFFGQIKDLVWKLKAKGYELAADDQGEGGASDRRLIEFKPHYIKVDQYFMRNAWEDQRELAKECLRSYCNISRNWNGKVLVEGITEHHNQKDLEQLLALGISLGQGYLLGEPEERIGK